LNEKISSGKLIKSFLRTDSYSRSIGKRRFYFQEGDYMLKMNFKKIGLTAFFLLIIFTTGFAGGIFFSNVAAGMGEETPEVEQVKAYPIYELGEFKLSLSGGEFTDPALVSFELVLELESEKVLEKLNTEAYWEALFRNEVITESMSQGQASLKSPEGLLRLSEDITERLNSVGPSFPKISNPVRRIFLRSFVLQ